MQDQNLFLRNDTFFGICEAIGTDFGFHPNWLRVAFAFALFFNPAMTVAAYLALGVPIALARWVYPVTRTSSAVEAPADQEPATTHSNDEQQQLPLAA